MLVHPMFDHRLMNQAHKCRARPGWPSNRSPSAEERRGGLPKRPNGKRIPCFFLVMMASGKKPRNAS
jgi:hypothetical protein